MEKHLRLMDIQIVQLQLCITQFIESYGFHRIAF